MVDILPGDVVSTSAAQADMLRVHAPVQVGLSYAFTLMGRAMAYVALAGDQPDDVIAGLAAEVLDAGLPIAVMVDDADLFLAGEPGVGFTIETAADPARMELLSVQEAVIGQPPGRLIVLTSRPFYGKIPATGAAVRKVMLTVRREVSGPVNVPGGTELKTTQPVQQVEQADVRTVLSRAASGTTSVFDSIALP